MKRATIIGIAIIISFTLGYWTNKFVDFAEGMRQDHAFKADSAERKGNSNEDFDKFILVFTSDRLFQLKRIKFPLKAKKLNELDGVDSTLVQEKDWKIINLFRQNQQQIYNNYQREIVDTDKRMIWYGGLDSGQDIEFRFQRLDGLWYLLEYNNLSN